MSHAVDLNWIMTMTANNENHIANNWKHNHLRKKQENTLKTYMLLDKKFVKNKQTYTVSAEISTAAIHINFFQWRFEF